MKTLDQFERDLEFALRTIKPRLDIGLARVGTLAQTLSVHYIGHEMAEWAPLAPSTIADKQKKGFPVPFPLLRTGDMRNSVHLEMSPVELCVVVGSGEKVALWQEMGTKTIPPRSFLGLGMKNSLPFAADVFGAVAVGLLMGTK